MPRLKPREHTRRFFSKRFTRKRGKSTTVNKGVRRLDFPKKPSNNRYHVTVIVPSTTGIDKPITQEKFSKRIRQTRNFLSKKFGGTTKVSGQGSFRLGKRIIKEPIAKVETFASRRNYLRFDQELKKWVRNKRRAWKQESIGVGFESPETPSEEFHFVK